MKSRLHSDLIYKCLLLYVTILLVLIIFIFLTFNPSFAQPAGIPAKLEWDSYLQGNTKATGIIVQRCRGVNCTNFWTLTPTPLPVTQTKFVDPNVYESTFYSWRIRAVNSTRESLPSNTVTAFVKPRPKVPVPLLFQFDEVP